jgi:hypothetical protein
MHWLLLAQYGFNAIWVHSGEVAGWGGCFIGCFYQVALRSVLLAQYGSDAIWVHSGQGAEWGARFASISLVCLIGYVV